MRTNPFNLQKVNDYGPLDVNSTPVATDLDDDGDLDVLSGERTGYTRYLKNISITATNPDFDSPITNTFGINTVSNFTRVAVVDINDDGKTDCIIGNRAGYFYYFQHTGTLSSPAFTLRSGIDNPLDGRSPVDGAAPAFCDLDNDGDQDLLAGQWQGHFYYFENTGTASSPAFPVYGTQNPYGLTQIVGFSHPTFGDLDKDGDYDLILGSSTGDIYYFENTGTRTSPSFAAAQTNPFDLSNVGESQSTPFLVDLDKDGDLDIIVGVIKGNVKYFKNISF